MKLKVKNNRPFYLNTMLCYVVDYSLDGQKGFKCFDTYKEGIEWLKSEFPDWFAKHYPQPKTETA